ncbi:hypothetical protein HYZ78_02240 [Candidatus Microgenomates bacterium]|nr:hypothetical protein [Candidatus Microgenomates bacterium]
MAKKNDSSEVVTKGFFRSELQKELQRESLSTKSELRAEIHLAVKELKESWREYIDSILTKIDPVLKEVLDAREERVIMNGMIDDLKETTSSHDKRISKLEHAHQAA